MKPTKQEMLDFIYEKVASKDLAPGCKVKHGFCISKIAKILIFGGGNIRYILDSSDKKRSEDELKKLGHDVLIGDVLYHFDNKWFLYEKTEYVIPDVGDGPEEPIKLQDIPFDFTEWASHSQPITVLEAINGFWVYKNKPIDDQPDNCIKYFYNLLKEYETTR